MRDRLVYIAGPLTLGYVAANVRRACAAGLALIQAGVPVLRHTDPLGHCPCTRGPTPGWAATGVTLGQIERMADRERVIAGDPGVPAEVRERVLAEFRKALERENV